MCLSNEHSIFAEAKNPPALLATRQRLHGYEPTTMMDPIACKF
jgi:hypothetical protein